MLVKNETAALAALKALTGAVRVNSRHIHKGDTYIEVFWPVQEDDQVSIKTIRSNQIMDRDPRDIKPAKVTLQLGQGGVS